MNIIFIFYQISPVLMLLACFIPLIVYLHYGREPKINYHAEYEVDLPTDDPPAIVNAICGSSLKKLGEPDMDGFIATIMDLIDRNYLLLKDMSSDNADLNSSGSIFLEINLDYDPNTLWGFEVDVLNFLQEYEQDGIISMNLIFESLKYSDSAKFFKHTYKNWKNEVKQTLLTNKSLKEAFSKKGDRYLKIFGILGLITAIVVFFAVLHNFWALAYVVYLFSVYSVFLKTKNGRLMMYGITGSILVAIYLFNIISSSLLAVKIVFLSSIVLGAVSMISIALPQKIAGQWTTYGKEYYTKWHSFKKYIEDYSLIKEYPPKSVNVWNKYLVYATALGAAEEVRKAMELSIPNDKLKGSDLYSFHYYTSPTSLLKNAIEIARDSD